jgi:hypothetical protein
MSDHSFKPFVAKKYGITEAILINSFIFWTQTNAAKESNYHNDRFWFYGTPEYFSNFFIYLTGRQIKYALSNLIKGGAILKGNFNKKGYDKTNWYSLSDSLLNELNLDITCLKPSPGLIGQNCPMDRTKLSDGSDKIVRPIPDTKPDTKPDKKLTNCESSSSFIFSETIDKNILNEKPDHDTRSNDLFMKHVIHHVENNSDKKYKKIVRVQSALKMLKKLKSQNIIFESSGFEVVNVKKTETEDERMKRYAKEREEQFRRRNN